eukprot:4664487-Amphidinium_carterae.2
MPSSAHVDDTVFGSREKGHVPTLHLAASHGAWRHYPIAPCDKSDDAHVPRGTTTVSESSVKVDPSTRDIGCPMFLDGTRNTGVDEFD